jgi:hypothetical protein
LVFYHPLYFFPFCYNHFLQRAIEAERRKAETIAKRGANDKHADVAGELETLLGNGLYFISFNNTN